MEQPPSVDVRRSIFSDSEPRSFGAYRDLYAAGSTVVRTEGRFEAAVTAYGFPGLVLFDRQVAGVVHQRDAARVRRDGFDHFHLQVLRSGCMVGGAWGEERMLSPGDAVLFDTTRPQRTSVAAADYVTVTIQRSVLEAALPDARRLHGAVLPQAVSRPLHAVVMALAHQASSLPAGRAAAGGRAIVDILAGIAGTEPESSAAAGSDADVFEAKRVRAAAFIEANLGRSDLDVAAVAAASGLSRSGLYRAFAQGGGVEREILRRRLARLRAALLRPGELRSLADLAMATGFASENHCSRAFKAAFGSAPNHLRTAVRRDREKGVGVLDAERMRAWYGGMVLGETGASRSWRP